MSEPNCLRPNCGHTRRLHAGEAGYCHDGNCSCEGFLSAAPPTAHIASDERVAEILDDQLTRMDGVFRTLSAPAAPLSTLPERPTQRMSVPTCTVCGKVATQQDIDGNWWPPCGHAKTNGTHTLEYLPAPELITELESLRSQLSSLERELDGVRTQYSELAFAGGQLANFAFNIARNPPSEFTEQHRETLGECARLWDATTEKHVALRERSE